MWFSVDMSKSLWSVKYIYTASLKTNKKTTIKQIICTAKQVEIKNILEHMELIYIQIKSIQSGQEKQKQKVNFLLFQDI